MVLCHYMFDSSIKIIILLICLKIEIFRVNISLYLLCTFLKNSLIGTFLYYIETFNLDSVILVFFFNLYIDQIVKKIMIYVFFVTINLTNIFISKIFLNHIPWLNFDLVQQYLTSVSLKYGFDDIPLFDWETWKFYSW